jgi:hypothetical protein
MDTGPIMIPETSLSLGSIQLDVGLSGVIQVSLRESGLSIKIKGQFHWNDLDLVIAEMELDSSFNSINRLPDVIAEKIRADAHIIFASVFADPFRWLESIKSQLIQAPSQISEVLTNVYHKSISEAEDLLNEHSIQINENIHVDIPAVHTDTSQHVDIPAVHTDTSQHVDIPAVHTDTSQHVDIPAVHTDTSQHVDIPAVHTDTSQHVDISGTHIDGSRFGVHIDETPTPHVDENPHIDETPTPHVDETPHIDETPTPHVDENPHIDETLTPHVDETPHIDETPTPHVDETPHIDETPTPHVDEQQHMDT